MKGAVKWYRAFIVRPLHDNEIREGKLVQMNSILNFRLEINY